jgi:hypothetical protein
LCSQKIDNDETLTDLSFDQEEDTEKVLVFNNQINKENILEINSVVLNDFDKKSFQELINENEIMSKDLKNANINYNDNDFYCQMINNEFISFIENNDYENILELLEY